MTMPNDTRYSCTRRLVRFELGRLVYPIADMDSIPRWGNLIVIIFQPLWLLLDAIGLYVLLTHIDAVDGVATTGHPHRHASCDYVESCVCLISLCMRTVMLWCMNIPMNTAKMTIGESILIDPRRRFWYTNLEWHRLLLEIDALSDH